MGLIHDPPPLSPTSERRRKISKQVETQINQQTEFKTSREVVDLVSKSVIDLITKSENQRGRRNQNEPGSQDKPINQDQPGNRVPGGHQGELKEQSRRKGISADWEAVENDPRLWLQEQNDAHLRWRGWARGRREEDSFRENYRFDDPLPIIFNKVYKTPMNSEVSRGPNSYWDTKNFIIEHRSTRKKIIELKKGESNNPALRALVRKNQRDAAQSNRFLQEYSQELGPGWKGVKVLGKGGQGIVGLWEYTGSSRRSWGEKVVIKMTLGEPFNHEKEIMLLLGNDDPKVNHASKLLHPTKSDRRGLDRDIEKLVLEYCEGGDLYTLIRHQKKKGRYFNEQTLWYFFACLVKGLNIMDHGDENPERKPDSRPPICHFDLKPANILIGEKDKGEHQNYPILKIADYGLAEVIHPTNYTHIGRARGTRGYLLPEQFSRRWAYKDAATTGHVNVWGTHSNIWSVGVAMYMLATLSGPPRPKGFRCALIGNKFTYGYKLKATEISIPLKRLIWRCLCDKPKERPSLKYLYEETQSTVEAINKQMKDYPLGLECDEPQDPKKIVKGKEKEIEKETEKGKEKEEEEERKKGEKKGKDDQVLIEGLNQSTEKPPQSKGKDRRNPPQVPARRNKKGGNSEAPILIKGDAAFLRTIMINFYVVPKCLPMFQQAPIWFTASIDTTVKQLKTALRLQAGIELPEDDQFLYHRTSEKRLAADKPDVLLSNPNAMLASGYHIYNGERLELWASPEDHDLHEPDETGFLVV